MKNIMRTLISTLLLSVFFVLPVQAQTALNTTTLTTAITSPLTNTVVVASATGATAATTSLYMNGEMMLISGVSGTTLTVTRGAGGTGARSHAANSYIWIGPRQAYTTVDPGGSCVASSTSFTPLININNARLWTCSNALWQSWQAVNTQPSRARVSLSGMTVAGGGNMPYNVLPTDDIVALSTTGAGCLCTAANQIALKTITLPSHLGLAGKQITIVDESGGVSATTSIVLAGTINGTHSSVATVVWLKTAYSSVTLHAGSGGWYLDNCSIPQATGVTVAMQCR